MTETKYEKVQLQIEGLLQKSINNGGFKALLSDEVALLNKLSLAAEQYEDNLQMMPIKTPTTLVEMIRFKMFEMNLKQKQLANLLEISDTRISELLCGSYNHAVTLIIWFTFFCSFRFPTFFVMF